MENLVLKINVRKKGMTNADVYKIENNNIFYFKSINLGVSSMPENEFVRWKLAEYLGHNDFKFQIL